MVGMHIHNAVNGREGRVLLVDDEADFKKPIAHLLVNDGYEVVEAANGEEAIKVLNDGENPLMVDIIVCDLRMPKSDGTEAIAYFRQQYPSIPVVVLTGYPDVQVGTSLMKQGVKDYLVKPVTKDNLLRVIRREVDEHRLFDN